jgi:hypothetical protein
MENYDPFDEELQKLVRGVEHEIPQGLEAKVRIAAETLLPQSKSRFLFIRRPILLASLSATAALLLVILFILPSFHGREEAPITEIRTQFELSGKNITIIFIQRPDFPALETVN